ncbi:MAG: benzoate-CoA ligase family protein [Burkholderiaceae bacterium]
MPDLSSVDHNTQPPTIQFPEVYNAAHDLIERNLLAGRGEKPAFIDDHTSLSYAALAARVNHFANALLKSGVRREDRVLICMHDTVDWPVAFLGAIKAGVVPIAANTMLKQADYAFMVADSRARAVFASASLMSLFDGLLESNDSLEQLIEVGDTPDGNQGSPFFMDRTSQPDAQAFESAQTSPDEACFWLYSSGSTGQPKGTVHIHSSLIYTAELYAVPVLGIKTDDVVFSAAKLFFAYGLGNGLTFPMAVGATALLMPERPTPAAVYQRLSGAPQPTLFYGVPTLFAAMLSVADKPASSALALRRCASAGEALPEDVGKRFGELYGVEILDGIGSTEMLHIFLSNRPGRVRYGSTGEAVPGYEIRLLDDTGAQVPEGEIGDLVVKGPSAASQYWNQRQKTRNTFEGEWTRSGDKYQKTPDGYYIYAGRSDDMLKVSGQYVSPFEVESAIVSHESVLEAAVVGSEDADRLVKPRAFVVLQQDVQPSEALAQTLKDYVKEKLARHKYPRWIEFVTELPKTATGKIQRFKLRA